MHRAPKGTTNPASAPFLPPEEMEEIEDRARRQGYASASEYLLDLHRAQIRPAVPRRWLVKDLAGLLMSALEIGLTRRDRLRFVAAYTGKPWRAALAEDAGLWREIETRALRLKRKLAGRDPS